MPGFTPTRRRTKFGGIVSRRRDTEERGDGVFWGRGVVPRADFLLVVVDRADRDGVEDLEDDEERVTRAIVVVVVVLRIGFVRFMLMSPSLFVASFRLGLPVTVLESMEAGSWGFEIWKY